MEKLRHFADGKTNISLFYEINRLTLDIIAKVINFNNQSINDYV